MSEEGAKLGTCCTSVATVEDTDGVMDTEGHGMIDQSGFERNYAVCTCTPQHRGGRAGAGADQRHTQRFRLQSSRRGGGGVHIWTEFTRRHRSTKIREH